MSVRCSPVPPRPAPAQIHAAAPPNPSPSHAVRPPSVHVADPRIARVRGPILDPAHVPRRRRRQIARRHLRAAGRRRRSGGGARRRRRAAQRAPRRVRVSWWLVSGWSRALRQHSAHPAADLHAAPDPQRGQQRFGRPAQPARLDRPSRQPTSTRPTSSSPATYSPSATPRGRPRDAVRAAGRARPVPDRDARAAGAGACAGAAPTLRAAVRSLDR